MDITQLLAFTMQNDASDLHLSPSNPPIIRAYGDLKRVKVDPLESEDIRSMVYSIMTEDQRTEFERDMEIDFSIALGDKARFRVNCYTTRKGTAAVFRTIPSLIPTMEELELPPVLRKFAELEKGMVLIAGQTGSGKSTTLASMINHINEHHAKHIVTIEDPVEFFHTSKKSLVNHREVGTDTKSFARALKSALREDPDVILVGEMRDYETMALALTAAETGHLVFGTVHANTAPKTIDRIIDVFPSGDKDMARTMLSTSIQGVVQQNLLKRADGSGRVGAHEILVGTNAVRNLIRENQISQLYSMLQTGMRYGMQTLEDAVNDLLAQRIISKAEARRVLSKASDEQTEIDDEEEEGTSSQGHQAGDADEDMHSPDPAANIGGGPSLDEVASDEEGYSF